MHPAAMAKRRAEARKETQGHAASLARKLNVQIDPDHFNVKARNPHVRALRQEEAMRDFLKELDGQVSSRGKKAQDKSESKSGKGDS